MNNKELLEVIEELNKIIVSLQSMYKECEEEDDKNIVRDNQFGSFM